MERTEYRRSASRPYNKPVAVKDTETLETVLTQCIISGVVLLVILLLCLVKTEFTQNIRTSIKTAIAGDTNFDGIKSVFNIQTLTPKNEETPTFDLTGEGLTGEEQAAYYDTAAEVDVNDIAVFTEIEETVDSRIDEDILAEINSKTDTYGNNLKK